jgi:hypothetical protein
MVCYPLTGTWGYNFRGRAREDPLMTVNLS